MKPEIASGEIFPESFEVFRRDRATDSHGGVFIAVRNTIIASEATKVNDTESESICVSIKTSGAKTLFVGAFYRSQATADNYMDELEKALHKIPSSSNIILLGDFNLLDVDWQANYFPAGGRYPVHSRKMINIALDFNLEQTVIEPTRGQNILDLCFSFCRYVSLFAVTL